jgi:AraC-like DNA-binding protein
LIEYKQIEPSDLETKKYISSYTYSLGSLESTSNKYITRAFPTFHTQLYFEFYGNISKLQTQNSTTTITKRTYVNTGIGDWFDIFELESSHKNIPVKNFKVDLLPHTLFELFEVSPKELLTQDLKVEDIWKDKQECHIMLEQMEASTNGEEMIALFEKHFLKLLKRKQKKTNPYLSLFLRYNPSLEDFSKELGYSRRWIQKEYQDIFGLGFKELHSNMRFLKTLQRMEYLVTLKQSINFSLLANECNYYDQAHLIKEFKKYSGMTPKEYITQKYKDKVLFYW